MARIVCSEYASELWVLPKYINVDIKLKLIVALLFVV